MRLTIPLLVVLLAACQDDRPPAPTAEQSVKLDEAEAMLDNLAANEKEPADRSAGSLTSVDR